MSRSIRGRGSHLGFWIWSNDVVPVQIHKCQFLPSMNKIAPIEQKVQSEKTPPIRSCGGHIWMVDRKIKSLYCSAFAH